MGSQLFYSYTSSENNDTNGSYLAQSQNAIVGNSAYTYSLVFDVNRRTIWSQDKEYGTTKMASVDYAGSVAEIQSGIPVQTYNGTFSYFYVNENGELSVYNTVKIISFDVYNGTDVVTGQQLAPGEVTGANFIDKFKFSLSGTDAHTNNLKEVKLFSNISIPSNYPSTSGTNVSVPVYPNTYENIEYDVNSNVSFTGSSGNVLTATLRVKDRLDNIEEKTIIVAEFMYMIYYGTASSISNINLSNFNSQVFGNIASADQMNTINGTEYFWVLIPVGQTINTCKMYQGGGEAEWSAQYSGNTFVISNKMYKVYRTPKRNIGGAEYYVKIN